MKENMKRFAALLLSAMMALCMLPALAEDAVFEDTVDWDGEYDVVVVGFGGAGAVTAITAADAGAKVLLLEKAPEGEAGGNTRYAAQIILCPTDREGAITYFKAMRGGFDNQSDEVIETIVDGAMAVPEFLEKLGADPEKFGHYPLIEYPELPGSESISTVEVDGELWTSKFWQLLLKNVNERTVAENIDLWYEAPATDLIQDPATRIIHGVKVAKDGRELNIRARNGVVLCCGGFENNEDMIENYVQMPEAYSKGARYNTGDGIKMAMAVGADLWHMSTLSGPDVNFVNPETGVAPGYFGVTSAKSGAYTGFTQMSAIVVGADGTRYMNETVTPSHGHVNFHGMWVSQIIPNPSYMIFDEKARLAAPVYPSWSEGNADEIEKGWIIKADTLDELNDKLGLPAGSLAATVEKYNGYCAAGEDPEYATIPEYLVALDETGPYYALPLKATFTNTQGGPKRNVQCEVLDTKGRAIPHLYSAGELGSFYCDIYNGGGNLAECVFSGRAAGANAAAAKSDVAAKSVMEGKTAYVPEKKESAVSLSENERMGEAQGMGGTLSVKVTMDGEKIAKVEVVSHTETAGISDGAIEKIPAAIVEKQSTDVDTVSGATVTSKAIIEAVNAALAGK